MYFTFTFFVTRCQNTKVGICLLQDVMGSLSLFYILNENTLFQPYGILWKHGIVISPGFHFIQYVIQFDFGYKTLQRYTKQKFRFKYVHPVERWTSKVYVLAHKHATTSCCLPLQRVFSTLTSRNNAVTFHLVNELWLSLLSSTFKQMMMTTRCITL